MFTPGQWTRPNLPAWASRTHLKLMRMPLWRRSESYLGV